MNKIQKKLEEALTGRFKLAAALQKREQERKAKDEARAAREKQQQQPVKETVEPIDEISTKALQSYRQAAHTQIQHSKFGAGKDKPEAGDVIAKREKGMASATAKVIAKDAANRKPITPQKTTPYKPLGGRDEKSGRSYSEGVEQMDELSKKTLGSYAVKAKGEMGLSAMAAGAQGARGDTIGKSIDMAHAKKRSKGVDNAIKRLTKEENNLDETWYKTGKEATHMATGQKTYEYQKVDKEGKPTGERHYRNADGKILGEESELEEAASPAARFNQKVKQAQAAHEAGDHKKAKYHLDTARNFMLGVNSNDHGKIKDSYPKYKELRDLHTEEVVAEEVYEAADTKPGWMLRQDPVLAKKVADAQKLAKKRQASYGDPSKGISVKEENFKQFRASLIEKTLTPAEMKKREEVAKAIEREKPNMPMGMKMAIATKTAKRVAEEVDDEGKMAKGQLMRMVNQASALAQMMDDDKQLDGWVQSKLTMASDYLDSVHDYLMHNKQDVDEMEEEVKDEYARKVDKYLKKKYNKEETVVETKGAPKGFHFTRDGKLKRGDANQDGDGGPMLRSDPLDKQRSKVPPVFE